MVLYHGTTNRDIKQFRDMSRDKGYDFGKGIYFTTQKEQAMKWSCRGSIGEGAVYECEIDEAKLDILDLKAAEKDEDIHYLLYLCRIQLEDIADETIDGFADADAVMGYMLDGTVKEFEQLAEAFNEGDILYPELKSKTKIFDSHLYDQICMKTDAAIDLVNQGMRKVYYTKAVAGKIKVVTAKKLN